MSSSDEPARGADDTSPVKVALIGGSAGSLAAIRSVYEAMPAACGVAHVVIQHRSTQHESGLHDLIGRWTDMPVAPAADGVRLQRDHVYVASPRHFLRLEDDVLRVDERVPGSQMHKPIDHYCATLAPQLRERAALVILSGSLDDGTRGAGLIKEAGGSVIVQSAASAGHSGMPDSVVSAGLADQVLEPGAIAAALCNWGRCGAFATTPAATSPASDDEGAFDAIVEQVRAHAGQEVDGCKPATLRRRIVRRMGLSGTRDLAAYLRLLERNPLEVDQLAKDLLIGVTAFFRDAGAVAALESEVIPSICAGKSPSDVVRVWVTGCSTGEEAYSAAMLLCEWRDAHPGAPRMQVFATDIDDAALTRARGGRYPRAALEGVSHDRLQRHFVAEDGEFRVDKAVRECIVFAAHDLLSDPPFSRLDLLVCRNPPIYIDAETQAKLLRLFHFALKPAGYLVLGGSESLGTVGEGFEIVSRPRRIFRKRSAGGDGSPELPVAPGRGPRAHEVAEERLETVGALAAQERAYRHLLAEHGPTQVLVGPRHQVLFVSGNPEPYLAIPPGDACWDLTRLVKRPLSAALQAVVTRAKRDRVRAAVVVPVPAQGSREPGGSPARVRIEAAPVEEPDGDLLLLIAFSPEAGIEGALPSPGGGGDDWVLRQFEHELNATREDLRRTIEADRHSTESMRAVHEDVVSMNEELQAANEELESSKEELQSLNEELHTSNVELEAKIVEVEILNSDLSNLIDSTDTATLLLDAGLRIRRFTPACAKLMRVIASDIGRPFDDLVHPFDDGTLVDDCKLVMQGTAVADREARGSQDTCYLRCVRPYRDARGDISGVVVSFPDISAMKQAEDTVLRLNAELERLVAERTAELVSERDRAERLSEVKSEFLANMSHEIRTPLNAVLGFAHVGRRGQTMGDARRSFDSIIEAGQLLLAIIDDVLDYARTEAGALRLEDGVVELRPLVEHTCELVGERARAKGLDLRIDLSPALPDACRGDRLRLSQVLLNVLSNAVKFTDRGEVVVTVGCDAHTLVIRVLDTGIGMSAEELERVFQPFQQADSSITRRFGGTGLGLAISHRLVRLMGGDIRVESVVGQGSALEIRVPLVDATGLATGAPPDTSGDAAVAVPTARLQGYSLLVAEDNELSRFVMEQLLAVEGARVVTSENGRAALERVQAEGERAFDLVFMDLRMPVMDGFEATRQLRELAPALPVVALTAHASEEVREQVLDAGMLDRLTKPALPDQLVAAVHRFARRADRPTDSPTAAQRGGASPGGAAPQC